MAQQQLLLIVLTVIIVVVSISLAMTIFKSNEIQSQREMMMHDLISYSARAQKYYRTSLQLGGGSFTFKNFKLSPIDSGNANGSFSLATTAPAGTKYVPGSLTPISEVINPIYIIGCGKVLGENATDPIKAYVRVTRDSLTMVILN